MLWCGIRSLWAGAVSGLGMAVVISLLMPRPALSDDSKPELPRLIYAGFAFSGDYENRRELYPYSAEIAAESSGQLLDTVLREKLLARPALAQRVSLGVSDGKTSMSSLAFALVQESAETQRIDGKYWEIVTLQANVLAFERESRSVVASYPFRMRFSHVLDSPPTQDDVKSIIRRAYTAGDRSENIFDQWLDRFEKVRIRNGAKRFLRVTDVSLSPEAEHIIRDAGKSPAAIRNQVANFLEASVAEGTGVPLVPNSVGEAIGSKMAYRFANGDSFQLALPEPDFALTFLVRDFVSKTIEEPAYFQDIFRVKGTIALKQPDTNRVVLDENIYDTLIVTRPKRSDVQITNWDQYFKVLQGLIVSVGKEMNSVQETWLKENASRGSEAKSAFMQAQKLMSALK